MKLTLLLILALITTLSISCVPVKKTEANTPDPSTAAYTSEQILEIARELSPACRLKKPIDWGAKSAG
jgi:hypothetical protein